MIEKSPYFNLFKDSHFDGNPIKELDTSKLNRGQWLAVRKSLPSIGGSDIGTVMGLNPYKSATRLFYEKIGMWQGNFRDNKFTFWGRMLEDKIIEAWRHWDGDEESLIDNQDKDIVVRDGRHRDGMLWNPSFPYVVANIDYEITVHPDFTGSGILECKTISGYAADKWESGLPVYYIPQPYGYMIVTGSNYCEFAVLQDGRDFSVHTFVAKDNIINEICNQVQDFCVRLEAAYETVRKERDRNKLIQELSQIEPLPDESEDYSKFASEKHQKLGKLSERSATEEEIALAMEFKRLQNAVRDLSGQQQGKMNRLKKMLSDSYTKKISWPGGSVSFNKKFIVR